MKNNKHIFKKYREISCFSLIRPMSVATHVCINIKCLGGGLTSLYVIFMYTQNANGWLKQSLVGTRWHAYSEVAKLWCCLVRGMLKWAGFWTLLGDMQAGAITRQFKYEGRAFVDIRTSSKHHLLATTTLINGRLQCQLRSAHFVHVLSNCLWEEWRIYTAISLDITVIYSEFVYFHYVSDLHESGILQ